MKKRLSLVLTMIMVAAILGIVTVNASAGWEKKLDLAEEEKIREMIYNYFDKRYRSRAANQVGDFRELTDGSSQADSFLKSETDKLEIEIHNANLYYLGYTQYEYILDFDDIEIDKANQSATVSLTEGHDVIFEISAMISPTEPIVSKMRNLVHTIALKKTQNGWKIASDHYGDDLWRMLRATKLSKDELLRLIDELQDQSSTIPRVQSLTFSCNNLQPDESTHPYNRSGAIAYAHKYALTPNPAYYYFPENDCTNFVNQAIHHGSNADEVGSGTFGWYYNTHVGNDYSASWTNVQELYDLIVPEYFALNKGPEGCDTNEYYALPGDLVQFEKRDDLTQDWDHSVIIVQRGCYSIGCLYYVAGHSDNIDNYPLSSIISESQRFIRIERIDGYSRMCIPSVVKGSLRNLQDAVTNPYPAPLEQDGAMQPQARPSPYPAP